MSHKVLICGGREWRNREQTFRYLDDFHARTPIYKVVHGAARGADTLAGEWARARGIPVAAYPVSNQEWRQNPGGAGHARNQRMLSQERPTHVIAFPGRGGTADMVRRAQRAGLSVFQYRPPKRST